MSMESPAWLKLKGHVVAMPYPSRGHINPMMSLCKFFASRRPNEILITFVVTQEWLGFIGSDPKLHNIRLASIPNVIPLESQIAADIPGFFEAAMTKMKAPFEQLLEQLEPPVTAIVADVELGWPTAVGKRRNIPVALLWTMSASFFCLLHHLDILAPNRRFPVDLLDEHAEDISGISSSQIADVRKLIHENDPRFLKLAMDCISQVSNTDYLLLNTIQELETEPINSLKSVFPFRLYPIGPAIPFMELDPPYHSSNTNLDYIIKWLDSQPNKSVLYISFGSFLSVSSSQIEELASALKTSGIRFLWVARTEAFKLKENFCGERGLVVPWCDQLKVLSHCSIVGFWSHCGWNSTLEAVFAGVPILGFPLFLDQASNCRKIVEEWGNGWKVKRSEFWIPDFVTKEEILQVLGRVMMEVESEEGNKIRERARELKAMCRRAIAEVGSSKENLDAFVQDILSAEGHIT